MFTKLEAFLRGKKTFIVAALLVVVSLLDVVTGDMTVSQLLNDANLLVLLNGLGLASLRAGISK